MLSRNKIKINRILRTALSVLTMIVSGIGVLFPAVYSPMVLPENVIEYVSFDVVSFISAAALLVLNRSIGLHGHKRSLISLGIAGYLFYIYGVYVLGNVYTVFYVAYILILSLALFSIIIGLNSLDYKEVLRLRMNAQVGDLIGILLILLAGIFSVTWITRIVRAIQAGSKPMHEYPFYILDLSFVLPVFVITAVLLFKRHWLGNMLAGVVIVYSFILSTPTVLAEVMKILVNRQVNTIVVVFFAILAIAGFIVNVLFYSNLTVRDAQDYEVSYDKTGDQDLSYSD